MVIEEAAPAGGPASSSASGSAAPATPPAIARASLAQAPVARALLPFVIPAGPQPDANITDLMDPTNRGMWPEGLSPGSNITDMHIWLKAREKPVYGLKAQVWRRVLETEHAIKRDMLIAQELQRQLDERREGHDMQIAIPLPTVAAPTAAEREAHARRNR